MTRPVQFGGPWERLFAPLRRWTYLLYVAASGAALALDMGLFLALLAGGMTAMGASASGYIGGIVLHWLISSRVVFAPEAATIGNARHRQKMLFVLSALVGLALTVGVVGLGEWAGIDPRLAKLAAIAVSFQATYMLRRSIVFARG